MTKRAIKQAPRQSASVEARRVRIRTILARTAAGRARIDAVIRAPDEPEPTGTLRAAVDEHVRKTLVECGGNISKAARRLGIERSSLQRRLKRMRGENRVSNDP